MLEQIENIGGATMSTETQKDMLNALQVLSTLTEVPVVVKEFQEEWLLISYDLPHSDEGDKARSEFLKQAGHIGAVQHTESVYLLPWTAQANMEVIRLAEVGKVYCWYGAATTPEQVQELSRQYDAGLAKQVDRIEERAVRILGHVSDSHHKMARKMLDATWPQFEGLARSVVARGHMQMAQRLNAVREVLQLCQRQLDGSPGIVPQLQNVMRSAFEVIDSDPETVSMMKDVTHE